MNRNLKTVIEMFRNSGVDMHQFEAAALESNPQALYNEITQALKQSHSYLEGQYQSADPKRAVAVLAQVHNFLKSLADISPASEFASIMHSRKLYDLKLHNLAVNNAKVAELKAFLAHALQTDNLLSLRRDLARAMRNHYEFAAQDLQEHVNRLKPNVGAHEHTARFELNDLSASAIDNQRSNGMFDPIKRIGHLLSSMFYLNYVVPYENAVYPGAKYVHKPVALKDEPQIKLNQAKWGSNLAQDGGPAQAVIPPSPGIRAQ